MLRQPLILAACLLAVPAFAQSGTSGTSPGAGSMGSGSTTSMGVHASTAMGDKEILSQIHMTNQMEIDMGKLGKSHAKNKAVKEYSEKMVKDHSAADKQVMETAKKEKLTVDKSPKTAEDKAKKKQMDDQLASLKKLKGDEFDKQLITAMVDGHGQAVTMLEGAQGKAMPDTNALVAKLLPQIQAHKDEATQLQGTLGAGGASGSK